MPQPFWLNDQVKSLSGEPCSLRYSAPNTGIVGLVWLIVSFYLDRYYEVGQARTRFGSVMCTGYIIKMGVTAVIGVTIISTTFAPYYLGLMTLNASVFSVALALLLAIWWHYQLKMFFKLLPLYMAESKDLTTFYARVTRDVNTEMPPENPPIMSEYTTSA